MVNYRLTLFFAFTLLAHFLIALFTQPKSINDTCIKPSHYYTNNTDEGILENEWDFVQDSVAFPNRTRTLAVGLSFVWRDVGVEFLVKTLKSFMSTLSEEEKKEVIFVVSSADKDFLSAARVGAYLRNTFPEDYGSNLFLTLVSPKAYPKKFIFEPCKLKRNYNDPFLRVFWRSKVVLDAASVIKVAAPLAKYYLHLEDDTLCVKENWYSTIMNIIHQMDINKHEWFLLRFIYQNRREGSVRPTGVSIKSDYFGGMFMLVFPSSQMPSFSDYLVDKFDDSPVDWLLGMYMVEKGLKSYNVNYNLSIHLGDKHSTYKTDESSYHDYSNLVSWEQCDKLFKP